MYSLSNLILLYPYPYQTFIRIFALLIIIVVGVSIYCIYVRIVRKMTERAKAKFHMILKIIGICILVFFFAELTIALITQHQVNKQLGFNYATPETPEGELFLITRIVPGKVMQKAGLKKGDRVQMWNTCHLYRLLIENQGNEAEFSVLRDNKEIVIRVKVPEMELPLRKATYFVLKRPEHLIPKLVEGQAFGLKSSFVLVYPRVNNLN